MYYSAGNHGFVVLLIFVVWVGCPTPIRSSDVEASKALDNPGLQSLDNPGLQSPDNPGLQSPDNPGLQSPDNSPLQPAELQAILNDILAQRNLLGVSNPVSPLTPTTSEIPTTPVWPNKFARPFVESVMIPVIGFHTTFGKYEYDWDNQKLLVARHNGRYDLYCGVNGLIGLTDTPCAHLVMKGRRYLMYPEKKHCCFCCDAGHGCGMLAPDWMKEAKFIREMSIPFPKRANSMAYVWDKVGLQHNLYVEDKTTREMLILYQVPNNLQVYPASPANKSQDDGETSHEDSELDDDTESVLNDLQAIASKIMDGAPPDWCNLDEPCSIFSICSAVQRHQRSPQDPNSSNDMYARSITQDLLANIYSWAVTGWADGKDRDSDKSEAVTEM